MFAALISFVLLIERAPFEPSTVLEGSDSVGQTAGVMQTDLSYCKDPFNVEQKDLVTLENISMISPLGSVALLSCEYYPYRYWYRYNMSA